MMHEFEGKTEKEAIDNAINALGLNREEIDIEIVENKKSFLFGGGKVKIKVHLSEEDDLTEVLEPEDDTEKKLIAFLSGIIKKMNFEAQVSILFREENKLGLDIESENAAVMIGRQGKTLDSFQLLLNIYAGRIGNKRIKVVVDAEGYRQRRERQLMSIANRTADQVRKSRGSKLLEAMNPFERRLIHTTLSPIENIETISEGEGLFKKIRVFYKE
jgi:spoIIIJ-associated protein